MLQNACSKASLVAYGWFRPVLCQRHALLMWTLVLHHCEAVTVLVHVCYMGLAQHSEFTFACHATM
jgi:hypothetical protein